MRKRVFGKKLSRGQGARKALFRSLVRALVQEGSIVTTKTKAKITQRHIEKIINLAKRNTLSTRRRVNSILANDRKTVDDIFNKILPEFPERKGGYTRITNLPARRGDAANISRIEWVKQIGTKTKAKSKKGEKPKKEKESKRLLSRKRKPKAELKDKKKK